MSDPTVPFNPDPAPTARPRDKGKALSAREEIEASRAESLRIIGDVPKAGNLRQRRVGWTSFVIVQLLMLMLVVSLVPTKRAETIPAAAAPAAPAPAAGEDTTALQIRLSKAQDQIISLQKQIDEQRADRERTQATLQEMADRMALVIKQASYVPGGNSQNLTVNDASQVAAMLPSVTPATSELVLLKERNRLTDYADRAISTGAREGLQAIVETMFNPQSQNMHHAAGAEFRRVQAYFEISSSIDPNYKLPLQELFKDGSIRAEADLKPGQIVKLLHDHQQPWEVRLRCAFLLRASADPGANAALLKTIHEDPSLDVVKQAQTSFEKRVGQRFRLFDIPSMDAWWASQTKK